MSLVMPQDLMYQVISEQQHYKISPHAFFQAWKKGVVIAGPRWFGDGTQENLEVATSKWDLCPRMQLIRQSLGVLSSGEKLFLSAMASFYNADNASSLLKRSGFRGLADLDTLDLQRRQVISKLTLYYHGW
ncbi:hypothetical protein KVP09_09955 [Alcaligenaceae bacterium CGII-47]|nr:hypothetical protein [Alcaligenaceae bacterium CGII-47]